MRKRTILNGATEIFYQKGYHATSIQDIGQAVGMLKGSLYYHISSKDDLLFQVISTAHHDGYAFVQPVFESNMSAVERLREFVKRHVMFCASHHTETSVYLHEYKALPAAERAEVAQMRNSYEEPVRAMLEDGKREGLFSSEIDTSLTVKAILGMTNSIYHWYSTSGGLRAEEIAESCADLLLRGIEA